MEYTIHNTIPVIVINLLTTKFFGGFSFRKTSGVQTMKTNFILRLGGTNAGATCTVDSQCPGGKCVQDTGIDIGKCTPENCKPLTTGWGSCGSGANSYVECEATAQCVGDLCMQGKNYRCVAGAYGNPSASNKTACAPCPSPGTSAAGSTSQSCYIPAGTTGSDSTGTYKYTSNCYYK